MTAARQKTGKLVNCVDWALFASRHNMKWSKKAFGWDNGAFLGNGLLGTMIYSAEDKVMRNALRCVTGRTDVEVETPGKPGVYTRVPIGEIDVEMDGWLFDGTRQELDIYQAEFRTNLVTVKGTAKVRSLIHSLDEVILIEAEAGEGEHVNIIWRAYQEVPDIMKNEDGINYNQYIPEITLKSSCVGNVTVQEQKFSEHDGCTVAYMTVEENGDKRKVRFYLTVQKGFGTEAVSRAVVAVQNAAAADAAEWEEEHRAWWRDYFQKSLVSCSDTRLEGFYMLQMYKLACATRADKPIMDNQGPWMTATPWPRAWFNMNVQMAYSPVYTSNHLEIGESLCNSLDANIDNLIANVAEEYRADSAGLGRSAGCNMISQVEDEVGNLVWTMHNYWRQYRYSMDDERLRDHLYPLLKRGVQYYIHLLYKGEDGKLHLPAMISPEYGSFKKQTMEDTTYDLSLLRWGLLTLKKIVRRLEIEDAAEETWSYVLDNLVDYHQDETGFMVGKDVPLDFGHRHFSHLLPIFPLHLYRGDTEEEKQFVHHCLRHWFHKEGDLRGFTFSGATSIAAAIGAGDEALAYVKSALHLFKPNTMYAEAGPVIESPLAVAEGINDMLLQSWGDDIRVFPAVPSEWPDVTIHNLRAEGGFLVSAVRSGGETKWIRVESLAGEPCRVRTDMAGELHVALEERQQAEASVESEMTAESQMTAGSEKAQGCGRQLQLRHDEDGAWTIDLKKGEAAFLYAGDEMPEFVLEPVAPKKNLMNFFGENKPWRLYGIPFED